MKRPLCKEITIVDDCDPEMLEEFQVQLQLVEAECAEVEFHPNYTTVKIIDNDGPEGNVLLMHCTHTLRFLFYYCLILSFRNCVPDARTTL